MAEFSMRRRNKAAKEMPQSYQSQAMRPEQNQGKRRVTYLYCGYSVGIAKIMSGNSMLVHTVVIMPTNSARKVNHQAGRR